MGNYNYEYFICEYIQRTKEIRDIVIDKTGDRYKATLLINSLFGLLIVPNEKYKYKNRNGVSEETLSKHPGYQGINKLVNKLKNEPQHYKNTYGDDKRYKVYNFLRHLRNALAHSGNGGIYFLPIKENTEIQSVLFYDKEEQHQFCVELDIPTLEKLTNNIALMYSSIDSNQETDENKKQQYIKEVEEKKKLFEK